MALPNRGPRFNPRFQRQQEPEHRINDRIRVPEIRLVGENITVGVYNTQDALKIAAEQGLDLVEISPTANPPVCKVIDYKKFLYEKKRKEKEMKANSKQSEIKEIRVTPGTDDHDFDFPISRVTRIADFDGEYDEEKETLVGKYIMLENYYPFAKNAMYYGK